MPVGRKATHDMFSKKIIQKQRDKHAQVGQLIDGKVAAPPTVNNFLVNQPQMARSINAPMPVKGARKNTVRNISPMEGLPAVNGQSSEALAKKAVAPFKDKVKKINPADAAIKQSGRPKKKANVE